MKVRFTDGARSDLVEIRAYLARHAGAAVAVAVIKSLREQALSLRTSPERGSRPPELASLGLLQFRELHEPPYRIIYSIQPNGVAVLLIADARRDFRTLLERRLLR